MIWFDRQMALDLEATVEVRVRWRTGGRPLRLSLLIDRGRMRVRPGATAKPVATATLGARDALRLATGAVRWPQLLSTGRLEVSGDPFVVLRLPTIFRLRAEG